MNREEKILELMEEKIWYSKIKLRDKGVRLPELRPMIDTIQSPWEAVYWAMEDLKQQILEELYNENGVSEPKENQRLSLRK
jgi:hypothetical protein